jgi:hypothetical protein
MATTVRQDSEFVSAVISSSLLEEAIDWIQSNMNPEDVFDDKTLSTWAEENGYEEADE